MNASTAHQKSILTAKSPKFEGHSSCPAKGSQHLYQTAVMQEDTGSLGKGMISYSVGKGKPLLCFTEKIS